MRSELVIMQFHPHPDQLHRALTKYLPLAGEIEGFWLEGSNREAETWREHREINMVMLATSLAPDGFLGI